MIGMASTALPTERAGTNGEWHLAEELMGGRQCTLEAWMARGELVLLGIVDSIRLPNRVSFTRFEYPSRLSSTEQQEIVRIAERVMRRAGFDGGIFNIEFFVDAGQPKIIEINPRFCEQFSDLYQKTQGRLSHQVLVELASGEIPEQPQPRGRYRAAASFVLRTEQDCIARRVPSAADIARVQAMFPETIVKSLVSAGEKLSDRAQDSYTFRYGLVHLGADSPRALQERFERVKGLLRFELEP